MDSLPLWRARAYLEERAGAPGKARALLEQVCTALLSSVLCLDCDQARMGLSRRSMGPHCSPLSS